MSEARREPAEGRPEGQDEEPTGAPDRVPRLSRRAFVRGAATGIGVAAAAGGGYGIGHAQGRSAGEAAGLEQAAQAQATGETYPFYDQPHTPGVSTTPQKHSVFMTMDVTSVLSDDLKVLLARWSAAIAQLMAGETIANPEPDRADAVTDETGEALDLGPQSLTVAVGFGPSLFDDRFGLSAKQPALLVDLPRYPSDQLDDALCGGDLCIHACSDDPQVAFHAVRELVRLGRGTASTRWTVIGFNRASAGPGQTTPRNLLGFKDGTRNVSTDDQYDEFVWVDGSDQAWMDGGTYVVSRKIRMMIETWDVDPIGDQQTVFGRTKRVGAPLTGTEEFDTPDFSATDDDGNKVIDPTAHIALAAPENNDGVMILRRPYNYTDGINELGQLDAGLHFLAYVNDPDNFSTLQTKLGNHDLLNEYLKQIGSAVFALPPAPSTGRYIGQELFE